MVQENILPPSTDQVENAIKSTCKFVYILQAVVKHQHENKIENPDQFTIEYLEERFGNQQDWKTLVEKAHLYGLLAKEEQNDKTRYFFSILMSGLRL